MKVFYKKEPWHRKVNFVDDNNVLLGYSDEDDCCAKGGWFLHDKEEEWLEDGFKEESLDLPGWSFDTTYFKEPSLPGEYAEGGAARFRLVNGYKQKFLTLYNHHNGYYARGFSLSIGGKEVKEGGI